MAVREQAQQASAMQLTEKTLAIIKPEARDQLKQIENEILKKNLMIAARKDIVLTKEQCVDFSMDSPSGQNFCYPFEGLAGKTCHAMLLSGRRAIATWKRMIQFLQSPVTETLDISQALRLNLPKGSIHASENFIRAQREIEFIFPEVELESWSEEIMNYLAVEVLPTLTMCLVEMVAAEPENPLAWLARSLKEKATTAEEQPS